LLTTIFFLFFQCSGHHRALHSFPTRRSSDLTWPKDAGPFITLPLVITRDPVHGDVNVGMYRMQVLDRRTTAMHWQRHKTGARHRSEEHTSELQSRENLVCRLLLEKKKDNHDT